MKIQFTKIEEKLVTVEITEEEYKNLYNEDYTEVVRATETGELRPFEKLEKVTYPEDDRNLKIFDEDKSYIRRANELW